MDLPPLTSSPTSSSPPLPSRRGDRLARRVRSKGQGSLCLYGGSGSAVPEEGPTFMRS